MKPNEKQIEAYKDMAKGSVTMEQAIWAYLAANCDKFNQDKMDRCMKYLNECALSILDGETGDIPDEVCYRICMDYFNDEIWKEEEKQEAREKAEKQAKEAAQRRKEKQLAADKKTKTGDIFSSHIDDVKMEPKECTRCKTKVYTLYEGLCATCKAKAEKEKNNPQLSLF